MDKESLEAAAGEIANIVLAVDTDFRGNLFDEIGKKLRINNQYFTASMFEDISAKYGMGLSPARGKSCTAIT